MRGYTNIHWSKENGQQFILLEFTRDSFLADVILDFNKAKSPLTFETINKTKDDLISDTTKTFILKAVPITIQHQQVNNALSYYDHVISISDIFLNRYTNTHDIRIIFSKLNLNKDKDLMQQ